MWRLFPVRAVWVCVMRSSSGSVMKTTASAAIRPPNSNPGLPRREPRFHPAKTAGGKAAQGSPRLRRELTFGQVGAPQVDGFLLGQLP